MVHLRDHLGHATGCPLKGIAIELDQKPIGHACAVRTSVDRDPPRVYVVVSLEQRNEITNERDIGRLRDFAVDVPARRVSVGSHADRAVQGGPHRVDESGGPSVAMQHDYNWKGSRSSRDEDGRCSGETGRLLRPDLVDRERGVGQVSVRAHAPLAEHVREVCSVDDTIIVNICSAIRFPLAEQFREVRAIHLVIVINVGAALPLRIGSQKSDHHDGGCGNERGK